MNLKPLVGAAQLAVGRGEGVRQFGSTVPAFLASLAPLVAFPLVGGVVLVLAGGGWLAVAAMLQTLVAQLAPPVLSQVVAARWGRAEEWLRYATAYNWCQWALPLVAFGLMMALQPVVAAGFSDEEAAALLVVLLLAYGIWLNWLIARHGLLLSRLRALGLVLLVNLSTGALIVVPRLLVRAVE